MAETKRERKGPSESATSVTVGTKRTGNDGAMWTVIETKSGVHRWKRDAASKSSPACELLSDMTTKYYGMADSKGKFVSMPLMCFKQDKYAVVEFRSARGIGSFASYSVGEGVRDLKDAKAQRATLASKSPRKAFAIYRLASKRGNKSTQV